MPGTSRGSTSRAYAVRASSWAATRSMPMAVEVVDGGAQADGRRDVRRAGLELVGDLVEGGVPQVHGADHLAAAHEGRHGLEELAACPERAGARWAPGPCGRRRRRSRRRGPARRRAGAARPGRRRRARGRPAAWACAHHLLRPGSSVPRPLDLWVKATRRGRVRSSTSQVSRIEAALVVEGHELQVGVLLLGQQLPGHQVGVVLELGQHDGVRAADVAPAPGVGHEVDGLRGVAHEDDLAAVRCADEARHLPAGALVGGRGLLADGVDAAMDVGAVAAVVGIHGLDHDARLEGRGGAVQVGQAAPAEVALEDGEVAADGLRVEGPGCGHGVPRRVSGGVPAWSASRPSRRSTSGSSSSASISKPASRRMGA